ncbi:hypothetical protein Nepgr_006253 [Nepenthes gracilis]|uniref:F-box domain-containing protein n=1 Tax=Nepenthes gracilis TaxID=150966 RepID=A0AAD3S4N5_NEPGR|nr:hypothetical protein Nepgr_006253 [Nepenthes gracilis]
MSPAPLKKMMGHRVPWSDLPQELLSSIADCLAPSTIDIFRLRSVCKSWRSSLSPPSALLSPILPVETPRPPLPRSQSARECLGLSSFVLSATAVYLLRRPIDETGPEGSCVGPKSWLLFVDESVHGKLTIRHPLSRSSVIRFPFNFPKVTNLLDFSASEIGRNYNLSRCYNNRAEPPDWSKHFDKVVLLSNGYGVMVLYEGKLCFLRLGGMGTQWEVVHNGKRFKFDDIVEYEGKICGITRRGKAYGIDCHSLKMMVMAAPIAGGGGRRKRLVESRGELHLVVRCPVSKSNNAAKLIRVYKLKQEEQKRGKKKDEEYKWFEVKTLDNRVFFFALDFSFSCPGQYFTGSCTGNCILFIEKSFQNYSGPDDDLCVFKTLDSKDLHVAVFSLENGGSMGEISVYPGYSDILWPPPAWLRSITMSQLIEALKAAIEGFHLRTQAEQCKDNKQKDECRHSKAHCLSSVNQPITDPWQLYRSEVHPWQVNLAFFSILEELEFQGREVVQRIKEDMESWKNQLPAINGNVKSRPEGDKSFDCPPEALLERMRSFKQVEEYSTLFLEGIRLFKESNKKRRDG